MNDKQLLQTKLARLESTHDHLSTEVDHMDELLKKVGFKNGLETLKSAVHGLSPQEADQDSDSEPSSFLDLHHDEDHGNHGVNYEDES